MINGLGGRAPKKASSFSIRLYPWHSPDHKLPPGSRAARNGNLFAQGVPGSRMDAFRVRCHPCTVRA